MDDHVGHHGEHPRFEKATEALKFEHRIIEKVLDALEGLIQDPAKARLDLWEKAIDFVRNFADRCHHLKEEGVLFPALDEHGIPSEGGPVGTMLAEHEEGRGYVKGMASALSLAKDDPRAARTALAEHAKAYVRLLREHIAKEDQILFEMADAALTPEEQQQMLRQFDEHEEKEIGAGVHEKYLMIAEELERS